MALALATAMGEPTYQLNEIKRILANGFTYTMPAETYSSLCRLTKKQWPATNVTIKRFDLPKPVSTPINISAIGMSVRSKKKASATELSDAEWNRAIAEPAFKPTVLTQATNKTDITIVSIRTAINKITDRNFLDLREQILKLISDFVASTSDLAELELISTNLFEIATSSRFYSKLYADLYAELYTTYDFMRSACNNQVQHFASLFNEFKYIDPNSNYDAFCNMNKQNEKRKAIATFFVNLVANAVIKPENIGSILNQLIETLKTYIEMDGKRPEVDELTENIAIFLENTAVLSALPSNNVEFLNALCSSKVAAFKSMTSKALFKLQDLKRDGRLTV